MDIVVDFDGTVVTHDFPFVGEELVGAVDTLQRLVRNGHRLILFTMRCDSAKGNFLSDAIYWFKKNGIELYGIQRNPSQGLWTSSPKAYGQLIIDDAALGCPLIYNTSIHHRPFVDWERVEVLLAGMGLFEKS
jgi:hypothetical protein